MSSDCIDLEAQRLAERERERADLLLECRDAREQLKSHGEQPGHADRRILILTKSDLAPPPPLLPSGALLTSSQTGQGLAELRQRIAAALCSRTSDSAGVASTAARCGDSLRRAQTSLEQARAEAAEGAAELVAAEVRSALDSLGEVVGAVYTEDLLDRIFSRFCIGK